MILFFSCKEDKKPPPVTPEKKDCIELDSILSKIERFDLRMMEGKDWEKCTGLLKETCSLLEENIKTGNSECHFLNLEYFPDRPRFLFVESLRDRMETDTIPEAMYYLIRLRGIFSEDEEISEFFSEEIAHVAYTNPDCYLGYLRENPDQEVMLLYSTKWNYLDADSLIKRFSIREGAEPITEFLRNLKESHSATP